MPLRNPKQIQFVATQGYYRDSASRDYIRNRVLDKAKGRWLTQRVSKNLPNCYIWRISVRRTVGGTPLRRVFQCPVWTVSVVDKAGATLATQYDEIDAAESKWREEVQQVQAGSIVGVGLEETLVDGSIKPLKAVMSQCKQEADLFATSIRAKRTH